MYDHDIFYVVDADCKDVVSRLSEARRALYRLYQLGVY